jgi:hypothetical protein
MGTMFFVETVRNPSNLNICDIVCINYFSPQCDKIPDTNNLKGGCFKKKRNNLKEEGFILANVFRDFILYSLALLILRTW